MILLALAALPCAAVRGAERVDPADAEWLLVLDGMLGSGKRGPIAAQVAARVIDGRWTSAVATAPAYNQSAHVVTPGSASCDPAARTLAAAFTLLVTPDPWLPKDGQPFACAVSVTGTIAEQPGGWRIDGAYEARRADGQPMPGGAVQAAGRVTGEIGAPLPTAADAVWRGRLTQIRAPGGLDLDALDITLGFAGGRVRWGLIGVTAQPKWPAARRCAVDVSGMEPVRADGAIRGVLAMTRRHIHPGGDPQAPVRIELAVRLVRGTCSAEATVSFPGGGEQSRRAFGGGEVTPGGGAEPPRALWIHDLDTRPWWTPVAGFIAPEPGEHPRLLFRRGDLPALRERARTREGAAIVARLRTLLGEGGEAIPTRSSTTPPGNNRASPIQPPGAFTSWHAAGYGFLHQLTGERRYAELARQAIELMVAGRGDIDNRYCWIRPGTDLRCGALLAAVAYAYDWCYEAWPEDVRRQVLRLIHDYDREVCTGERVTLARLAGRSGYPPGSNHYGSLIGGTGAALLAIRGDPGCDAAMVEARLAEITDNIPRMLELGFGDGGWFAEGFGSSSGLSRVGMLELLHAMRSAAGRDYLRPRPNAEAMTLTWIMHWAADGWGAMPNRGVYEGDAGVARDGDIAMGFGMIDPRHRAALLWSWRTFVEPREPRDRLGLAAGEVSWAAERRPIAAVYSFVNWPIGVEPRDPAATLPLAAVDRVQGYFVARNRWRDADDVVVTHWLEYGPQGYYASRDGRPTNRAGTLRIWGLGLRAALDTGIRGGPVVHHAQAGDGSFTFTRGGAAPAALAVDFNAASGAAAVVVAIGRATATTRGAVVPDGGAPANATATTRLSRVEVAGVPALVMTLQRGEAPPVSVEGEAIVVGGQRYAWDGVRIAPAAFAAAAP